MSNLLDNRLRVATFLATLNVVAGLAVIAGWQFRIPFLKGVAFGTFVAPNTAACFVLCGVSLLLQLWGSRITAIVRLAQALAGLVTTFAAATCLEYLFHADFGIDRLLMVHRLQDWDLPTPGRFVLNTAIGFTLAGTSLVTLRRQKGKPVSEILACLVLLVAYQSLLGYLYSAAVLYSWAMALETIGLFLVLAFAVLCAASRQFVLGILFSPFAGAVATRRMLAAVAVLLPVLDFVALRTEKLGYVSVASGAALSTIVAASAFAIFAVQTADALNQEEKRRTTSEEERNRAVSLLAAIVNSSDDAIVSKTLDGIITSWNHGAERLFGYTAKEAIGNHITLIIPADRLDEEERIISALRGGERVDHFETVRIRKDGTLVDVSLTISPIRDKDGVVLGASKVARDVSERKYVEERLRKTEKMAAAGQLAASLAHEINNPLSSITNALYLLNNHHELDSHAREVVAIAGAELARMCRIVKQSLAYYRQGVAPVDIDLGATVEESIQVFSDRLQRADIRMTKKIEPNNYIVGFPDEIRQVIDNLLLNAVESMPDGGRLGISVHRSQGYANGFRRGVRFTIGDSGCGIPKEIAGKIFEPFFTTKPERGTGLGLWVVQGLIAKHDGMIRVRSSVRTGRTGTVVSILWPSAATNKVGSSTMEAGSVA